MIKYRFNNAKPIWADDIKETKNVHLLLKAEVPRFHCIKIATSGFYQLFVNGKFTAYGPARAGRGFFRVDEICTDDNIIGEKNTIEIILVSYGVDNFSNINQEPFVTCEVADGDSCICSTGGEKFRLYRLANYMQSISRYTFQRGFAESYICDDLHTPIEAGVKLCGDKKYIVRDVPYPRYEHFKTEGFCFAGGFEMKKPETYKMLQSERVGPEKSMQFWPSEENITNELQELSFDKPFNICMDNIYLDAGEYAICSFPRECTGMISFRCKAEKDSVLYVTYDETLTGENTVDAHRLGCNAVVKYTLKKGEYELISFEPVSMKYICFSALVGEVNISGVEVIEYKNPAVTKEICTDDAELNLIYDAAVETFLQNAVDIFTDCPSRERAGWLCDSYFLGKAEKYITDGNTIEKNFLGNFLMEDNYKYLPAGMLPMCYPADHLDTVYIPNWAMWLVAELEDYLGRTGDSRLIYEFKDKVLRLARFFEQYENGDGLLERLDKWVFVDWSESNNNVQDVSFPSNMMYAYMLECAAKMYDIDAFKIKADKIKAKIREVSFDGEFFCDNLIKTETGYKKSGVCTESCQYYAFFTGTATKELYPGLWDTLVNDFGFDRKNKYPDIPPSNAFIGNYIRLEILRREGLYDRLLGEVKGYFSYMARATGTLWEKVDDEASMNHGFASYAALLIGESINKSNIDR